MLPPQMQAIDELIPLAAARPIYIICSAAMPTMEIATVIDRLSAEYRMADFVNSRGLYRDYNAWCADWPKQQKRYGAAIVLTGKPAPLENGDRTDQAHRIADSAVREIIDMILLKKPVAWYPVGSDPAKRFAVSQEEISSPRECAALFPLDDAKTFTPTISLHTPWRSLALPPTFAGAGFGKGH